MEKAKDKEPDLGCLMFLHELIDIAILKTMGARSFGPQIIDSGGSVGQETPLERLKLLSLKQEHDSLFVPPP